MSWQPIATAPKDGAKVDLWMVDQDGNGRRVTDAYYVTDTYWETHEWTGTQWQRSGATTRDGWYAPNQDYDNQDGWCDTPRFFNPHPLRNKWIFEEPTHWMPLPAPPALI